MQSAVKRHASARIPTSHGEFRLSLFRNEKDDKDHLALVRGDVDGEDGVLVRVHSECFTGDVLGSLRCDCGEQLNASLREVAEEEAGIIIYLRQEGRGIGLLSKLRAYNLQDEGYDTVEANRILGHEADERDYSIAAKILEDLGVGSVRLLTNNPQKLESLEEYGVDIVERVPLKPHVNRHNADYLRTKVNRMRHILDLGPVNGTARQSQQDRSLHDLERRAERHFKETGRPFVTLTYAQSLDGSIASNSGDSLQISGEETLDYTHRLRALHDAILVGIGTVLADDPRLNVRRKLGSHPVPVVLDTSLRFPSDAQLLECEGPQPLIVTGPEVNTKKRDILTSKGATVVELPCTSEGHICLDSLLDDLGQRSVRSLMVEGGTDVLTNFLRRQLVQRVIITIAPIFVGGQSALNSRLSSEAGPDEQNFPRLSNVQRQWYGEDLILEGEPVWPSEE